VPAKIYAYENQIAPAINHFWEARRQAAARQRDRDGADQGNRAGVTAGKNMDGFISMVRQLIIDNGVSESNVFTDGRAELTIPGFYRPTKNWDLLVVSNDKLLAAIEFKSQVGPSFGNNFNNRVEEALGNAIDLNTAFREGAFGESQKPFLGYMFVLEECPKSLSPVRFTSPYFAAFPEFNNASYSQRYEILCRKLVQEQLYDSAALILTEQSGSYRDLSEMTSTRRFATVLAGKMAGVALEQ
jgi:hypothetical protein